MIIIVFQVIGWDCLKGTPQMYGAWWGEYLEWHTLALEGPIGIGPIGISIYQVWTKPQHFERSAAGQLMFGRMILDNNWDVGVGVGGWMWDLSFIIILQSPSSLSKTYIKSSGFPLKVRLHILLFTAWWKFHIPMAEPSFPLYDNHC